ncbi:B12-binding domain-containing radical SAM protein [Thiofilum flexile]|uniref:B12-binding domain-containing radical SAM protein n=1 Tax=Thiofilum flexile TaxID=125627 RepID=UPI00037C17C2|nr:B12-binding domain-containing radical SAM protein [Thiofilum flexile]
MNDTLNSSSSSVLLVDLNNFARYPTLAIGYLVAPLRQAGFKVEVLSPLAQGAPAMTHEVAETKWEHIKRRVYFSTHPLMQSLHEPLRAFYAKRSFKPHQPTLSLLSERLQTNPPDIILLSAYLEHYPTVQWIGEQAALFNIPVLLGGPAFTHAETIKKWSQLKGISAVFAGEADFVVADLVQHLCTGKPAQEWKGEGLSTLSNVNTVARPLTQLEQLPLPDFNDFPWEYYPHRIVPVMAGRGCSWNICTFCSDVITANGRTFRSRPLMAILQELKTQALQYQAKDFIFLDLKLNSDLVIWRGLIEHFQTVVPGGRWIATVHVDGKGEHGLDRAMLTQAKAAGLTRISFGLESGSQRVLKRMGKGTTVERNAQFIQDAHAAGLSVRCSMMLGYPGETLEDIEATRDFLAAHHAQLDRVRPARFKAIPGTRFERLYTHRPQRFKGVEVQQWDYRLARANYHNTATSPLAYRRVKAQVLALIHQINSKPLRDGARQFDGLM